MGPDKAASNCTINDSSSNVTYLCLGVGKLGGKLIESFTYRNKADILSNVYRLKCGLLGFSIIIPNISASRDRTFEYVGNKELLAVMITLITPMEGVRNEVTSDHQKPEPTFHQIFVLGYLLRSIAIEDKRKQRVQYSVRQGLDVDVSEPMEQYESGPSQDSVSSGIKHT